MERPTGRPRARPPPRGLAAIPGEHTTSFSIVDREGNAVTVTNSLGNLFGSRERIELGLGGRPLASLRELGKLLAAIKEPRWPGSLRAALDAWPEFAQLAHAAPRRVKEAAFLDETLDGDAVDLTRLPIQRCWPGDAGPLITFGLVVTRGTRQARQNLAIYRQQLLGRNRVIMRWLSHRGGALDFADWQQAHPGKPFPLLVAIGADPATMLAAVAPVPDSLSEHEFAGLLRGERSRVWHSALTGLDAPAGAEILLEGHIQPGDMALEGPFGDHTGYYNAQAEFPVFTVERMHLRREAIYHGSYMGRAPHDEPSVLALALNDVFVPILRRVFPAWQKIWDQLRDSPDTWQDGYVLAESVAKEHGLAPITLVTVLKRAAKEGILLRQQQLVQSPIRRVRDGVIVEGTAGRNRSHYKIPA